MGFGCHEPPIPSSKPLERNYDADRNTVPDAKNWIRARFDDKLGIVREPMPQERLKHCASCTCPVEKSEDGTD